MTRYRIEFAPLANRQLEVLNRKIQTRISSKIDELASEPRPPGCVKLKEGDNIYRVRVGDYRILYQVKDEILLVIVVKIGHRGDVYKK